MNAETAWAEAMKFENRPNPYPYFEELRRTPVAKVADKTYVVTGYRELLALAHDPRISSDISRSPAGFGGDKPESADFVECFDEITELLQLFDEICLAFMHQHLLRISVAGVVVVAETDELSDL